MDIETENLKKIKINILTNVIHSTLRSIRDTDKYFEPFKAYQNMEISKGKLLDLISKPLAEYLIKEGYCK